MGVIVYNRDVYGLLIRDGLACPFEDNRNLSVFAKTIPDPAFIIDDKGKILISNPAFSSLFSKKPD
jgi:transcriptional regulator of aromatic amino acid metabolism